MPFFSNRGGDCCEENVLFIYNPHAGKELLKPKLSDIIDFS